MTENEFKEKTKQIALRVMCLVDALPRSVVGNAIGKQLLRSGTSIGANYRAACRGKSRADVTHKLAIVEEEADESMYWIELLIGAGLIPEKKLEALNSDINEIVAMTVASIRTMRANTTPGPKSKIQNPK
ncbi:MAG: four helix bundle protein [Acidobacteriota bacterium]